MMVGQYRLSLWVPTWHWYTTLLFCPLKTVLWSMHKKLEHELPTAHWLWLTAGNGYWHKEQAALAAQTVLLDIPWPRIWVVQSLLNQNHAIWGNVFVVQCVLPYPLEAVKKLFFFWTHRRFCMQIALMGLASCMHNHIIWLEFFVCLIFHNSLSRFSVYHNTPVSRYCIFRSSICQQILIHYMAK